MQGGVLMAAQGLVYRYAGQALPALQGVALSLHRGRAVGLLGPNGSGKSTLMQLLAGVRSPQGGHLTYPCAARPCVAYVPQECAFYPDLSCLENLQLFAGMLPLSVSERLRRIEAAIATCRLEGYLHRRARHGSGGMQRRLNLALALLPRPEVLLLDEPTVGIDPQSRAFLLDRVRDLVREGMAVCHATHYMEEVATLCSHIVVLDRGRVIAEGALPSLLLGDADAGPFTDLETLFMHHTQRSLRD